VDTVLGWVAFESRRYRPPAVDEHPPLRARAVDVALVVLAAAPLAALLA
jgi:hypothetical protein